MTPEETEEHDDHLTARLAADDDCLALGKTPSDLGTASGVDGLGDDLAFLHALRQTLRRPATQEAVTARRAEGLPAAGFGRFHVRRELGRGGFGIVYLAHDALLGRDVALKVPRAEVLVNSEWRARFRREAQAAAGLDHANIVPLFEAGEAGPVCFLVSAYCPGPTLAAWLRERRDPVPCAEAASLLIALADATAHAHARGVVHRDLKPANILLVRGGVVSVVWSGDTQSPTHHSPLTTHHSRLTTHQPKITDFGLAKLLDSEPAAEPTRSGAIVGTASYMAPEQAAAGQEAVGPAADLYALGAILYELLTGRPPFQGESDLEILLRARADEPVPPRRLRPGVPRDLETICLKCLEKEPPKRYAGCATLAEDLRRFRDGRPILARPVGRLARAWRWGRRNPREAVLAALVSVLLLGGAAGAWLAERRRADQQAERHFQAGQARARAAGALRQIASLQQVFLWDEAKELLRRTEQDVLEAGLEDLGPQLEQARRDLDVAERLDRICMGRSLHVGKPPNGAESAAAFRAAFREYGLDVAAGDAALLGRQVREAAIREQLVAALDEWSLREPDPAVCRQVLAIARAADPDPWRDRFRDPEVRADWQALARLAEEADAKRLSPALLASLGNLLADRPEGIVLLRRALDEHPRDFWLNFGLAHALARQDSSDLGEVIARCRAALAVRPAGAVYNFLGNVLVQNKDPAGAIRAYRQAVEREPQLRAAYASLGHLLRDSGDLAGAIRVYRQAVERFPEVADGYYHLGCALHKNQEPTEAIRAFRQATDRNPRHAKAYSNLSAVLAEVEDWEGTIRASRQALNLNPKLTLAHFNLAQALQARGDLAGAVGAYRQALASDPQFAPAHVNLGNALKAGGDLAGAIRAYRQALEIDPQLATAYLNLGEALRESQDLAGATRAYRQARASDRRDANPRGALAVALFQQGRFAEAQLAARGALELFPADSPVRQSVNAYLQACEQRLEPLTAKLPAVLRGAAQAADAAEQLSLADLCQHGQKRYAAAVRLYAAAFAARPDLADDARNGLRQHAAAAAALAAAGQGEDAGGLEDAERARLRRQALAWLRADLAAWTQLAEQDELHRVYLQTTLRAWQRDPDLAGVRGADALAGLPPDEQQAWRAFWADVERRGSPLKKQRP